MPDQREAAARSVAEIIGAIDLLDAKERERLYLRLLMSRAGSPALSSALASPSGPPTASGHAATALPNPVLFEYVSSHFSFPSRARSIT